ncbi:Zn-ribbon domain-containing OB-fold protein [Pseudonocardia sp. T1-2H]|uniref:Zn-ribbon domain-containing OB-fold protein n=1 Tax=Pseudonocardia sp. T1-2H TaxID=3128899 RepID=UPI0031012499
MRVGPVRRDEATAAFFDGTARSERLLFRCPAGHFSPPYAQQCDTCASVDLVSVAAAGGASVVSRSVAHQRGGDRDTLVVAELDEGPWWWSKVIGAEPEQVAAGARLTVAFERADEESEAVPVFRLA